ncbi:hypothetical protein RB195_006021 [Necator americanus]|uniref:Endonuclease/exonuclease/phosphatase domain-containing protein n=1 Tax=Necator americanus TaxID=51031 RepID=A0ABR1BS47_NECAM
MMICTYNACTLASEAAIEDLMMQAKKIKYDVIGLTETRRRHSLNALYINHNKRFLLRGRLPFIRREEKDARFRERNPRTTIKWDLFDMLAGFWEDSAMDNIDEDYDRLVEHLHDCTKKAESFKTTTRRLSLEALKLRGLSLEQQEPQGTKNSRPSFAEMRLRKTLKGEEQKCWLKLQRRGKASATPFETSPVARRG